MATHSLIDLLYYTYTLCLWPLEAYAYLYQSNYDSLEILEIQGQQDLMEKKNVVLNTKMFEYITFVIVKTWKHANIFKIYSPYCGISDNH